MVYVSKDHAAGITKGSGTDPATISAIFDYGYDATAGRIDMPAGAFSGTEGWQTNSTSVAKFVNKTAPTGSTVAKVAVINPGRSSR